KFDIMSSSQRSRTITAIAIFASLAIVLHLSPAKIPAPYLPFLIYELWEIPIIVAFYLYGARVSLAVAAINFMSLLVIFPGSLQAGPIYNLIAITAMIFGLLTVYRITKSGPKFASNVWLFGLTIILGPAVRVIVMTIVNVALLPLSPPLGFSMAVEAVIEIIPLLAFFNASVAIYSILIARILIRSINGATRIQVKYRV
ncbi:hypothetical protein ACFL96_15230, partial [Thermoproteota archaeon]